MNVSIDLSALLRNCHLGHFASMYGLKRQKLSILHSRNISPTFDCDIVKNITRIVDMTWENAQTDVFVKQKQQYTA